VPPLAQAAGEMEELTLAAAQIPAVVVGDEAHVGRKITPDAPTGNPTDLPQREAPPPPPT
jgi:hypothetical protein